MKTQLNTKNRNRGYIIILVMFLCAASLLILTGVLSYTTTTANLNMRSNELSLCQNAAEAATEKVYAKMAVDFVAGGIGLVSNNVVNGVYQSLAPSSSDNSYFGQFNFYDPTLNSTNSGRVYVGFLTNYGGPLPSQYTNSYAATNSMIYRIVSNVTMPGGYNKNVIGTAQEDVLFALVPINTYAIFYNGELEFSDCATMTVAGRTHSNTDICTGTPSSLTFNDWVTTCGGISSPDRGGVHFTGLNENTTYCNNNTGWQTDHVSIQISIPMTNAQAIIQPQFTIDPNSTMGRQMEYYEAQMVLMVSNSPSKSQYGANPLVSLALRNSYNQAPPAVDQYPNIFWKTNFTESYESTNTNNTYISGNTNYTVNKIALPWLSLTNSFYDQREGKTNYITQIDVGALADWVQTNICLTNKMPGSGNLYPTILYVDDTRALTNGITNRLSVVRLVNAQRLPYNNNLGFSVATPNPLYVEGNYNITTNSSGVSSKNESMGIGATTNGFTVPSALISDALTILSPSWKDANSLNSKSSYTSRVATSMTLNAAIVTGNIPSTGTTASTFSGGVHNLTRLLEDWSGKNVTLTYNTSIVCLYTSQQATNQFQMPGAYYEPPTRIWGFDPTFYNPTREPPGIPVALVPIRFNWLQPPPGSVTTGIN